MTQLKMGECDTCGKTLPLRFVRTSHGEANACAICRGGTVTDVWEEFVEYCEEKYPNLISLDNLPDIRH